MDDDSPTCLLESARNWPILIIIILLSVALLLMFVNSVLVYVDVLKKLVLDRRIRKREEEKKAME